MMDTDKSYLDALTYLHSFSEGFSRYNWDRALTYKLNYGIHPGEFVKRFIVEGLLKNEVPVSGNNYKLSIKGEELVRANLEELSPILDRIDFVLNSTVSDCEGISIDRHIPYYSLSYLGRRMTIWIKRIEGTIEIVCSFPSETEYTAIHER